MAHLTEICEGLHQILPDRSAEAFRKHILQGRRKKSRNYLLYPKRISYIEYKQVKELPVFNLSKYKGGFHELAFNQRKKPFGSLAMRTLGDMYPDMARYGRYHTPPESDEQVPEYRRQTGSRRL